METSLYYQGNKDQFNELGRPMYMLTEPYVYEGKMIVEQTYPIIIDGQFRGIAGIDRALSDIADFLDVIKSEVHADVILVSRDENFVASTLGEVPLGDGKVGILKTLHIHDTPYGHHDEPNAFIKLANKSMFYVRIRNRTQQRSAMERLLRQQDRRNDVPAIARATFEQHLRSLSSIGN